MKNLNSAIYTDLKRRFNKLKNRKKSIKFAYENTCNILLKKRLSKELNIILSRLDDIKNLFNLVPPSLFYEGSLHKDEEPIQIK